MNAEINNFSITLLIQSRKEKKEVKSSDVELKKENFFQCNETNEFDGRLAIKM